MGKGWKAAAAAMVLGGLALAQTKVHPGKVRGPQTAALQIEVFSDFECPACRNQHENGERQLIQDFVDTGKAVVIYRDFPLPQHKYSRQAAKLANAAARMGKYTQVADALFAAQESWSRTGEFEKAATAGMSPADVKKLKTIAASPEIEADIERDVALGRAAPVTQTPTMIVSYKGRTYPLGGAVNYNLLKKFLEQLLSK